MFPFLHYSFALCCKKSTHLPLNAPGQILRWLSLALTLICAAGFHSTAHSQLLDTFDEARPKFRLGENDARAQLLPSKRTEPGLEVIEAAFGSGSKVYLVYPIDPCVIIDDLTASIRILCAQSGLRIGFRVVFPRSAHSAIDNPITEVILGTPIQGAGQWSTSKIASVPQLFEDRIRYLKTKLGPNIDLQDAYIDAVVLSIYSDPGTIKLKVDDLQVEGMVAPATAINELASIDGHQNPATLSVPQQLRNLQSSVPRWILHQGESLDYLRSLGFNAIVTNNPNDSLVIEQAAQTQMGVIARPPDLVPTDEVANNYRHVQGWLLGTALDQTHLSQTRNLVSKLTRFPQSLARPSVGEAMEMNGSYSRLSDWLAIPMPIPTRVRSSSESAAIMQSDLRSLAGRSIPLTSIVTQMPDQWITQKSLAARALGNDFGGPIDYDKLQVRLQFFRSMMQGTRGFIFRSGSPLDSGDPTSIARSEGYRGINEEIELLMPWIQAGQSTWRNLVTDSSNHTATVLETPKSQLAIIVASGPMDQICSTAPMTDQIKITLPSSGQLRNVFRITHGELETLRGQETPNGLVVTLDRPGIIEQIVSVVDPMPAAYLKEQLLRLRPGMVSSRIDITEQVLQLGQMALVSQRIPNDDTRWEDIRRAESLYRDSIQYLRASRLPQSLRAADHAMLIAQRVVRGSWEEAAAQFGAVQSSPLVASPLSLPLHWEFNRLLAGRGFQSLAIPGVPFRDTAQLYQDGWEIDRRTDAVESNCAVGANGPDGKPTLVLMTRAIGNQPVPTGYAGAVMRVSSPTIGTLANAMVHIEGFVRIQSPAGETQSGILICDSVGGESLGQLISSSDASEYSWRRFNLFRFINSDRSIRLHFETRGEMRAEVANLTVKMIVPGQPADLLTRPFNPLEAVEETQEFFPVSTSRSP